MLNYVPRLGFGIRFGVFSLGWASWAFEFQRVFLTSEFDRLKLAPRLAPSRVARCVACHAAGAVLGCIVVCCVQEDVMLL